MNSPFSRVWVAFSGKRRCGKNTAADYLRSWLVDQGIPTDRVFELAFADTLKEEYCRLMNISKQTLLDYKEEHRSGLQVLGAVRREERPDYWIGKLFAKVHDLPKVNSWILITDLRFRNEAEVLYKLGVHLIRISRPGTDRELKSSGGVDSNISEVDLDGWTQWHAKIVNDGYKTTLQHKVRREAERMFRPFLQKEAA